MIPLEISLHALNLTNTAGAFGTSDPFCVVTCMGVQDGVPPRVLGKTEVLENTLHPEWIKVMQLDYEMGQPIKLIASVYDAHPTRPNTPMGSAVFDVDQMMGARGNTKAVRLKQGGTLFCHVRQAQGSGLLRLKLRGESLKNTEGFLRKSDPFFELSRQVLSAGSLTWDNVFRSPTVKDDLNPEFETAIVPLSTLCGGNLEAPLLLRVYDFESSGKHVLMGELETTVETLVQSIDKTLELQRKHKKTGDIRVLRAEVAGHGEEESVQKKATQQVESSSGGAPPTFMDYVSGGCELGVVVAIDFTGSNGDPRIPGNLHHIDDDSLNDYEKAIHSIVGILSKYDHDQHYPVFGFGAKYDVVNHCFACNGNEDDPTVQGVDGIMDAYHKVFRSGLIMSSPTVFCNVMEQAAAQAVANQEAATAAGKQAYTILLILTDGAVSNVEETAATLQKIAQDAPLSIVIVGVGKADFGGMQFLDDLQGVSRDICQFVPFSPAGGMTSVDLTTETLREIPKQLVDYFQSKGIAPLPAQTEEDIVVEEEEQEIDLTLDFTEEEIVVTAGGNAREKAW